MRFMIIVKATRESEAGIEVRRLYEREDFNPSDSSTGS